MTFYVNSKSFIINMTLVLTPNTLMPLILYIFSFCFFTKFKTSIWKTPRSYLIMLNVE